MVGPLRVTAEQWNDIREWYDDYDGYSDELDDEEDWTEAEPEDIPFPDHDRRVDDLYSTQAGDVGDEAIPY